MRSERSSSDEMCSVSSDNRKGKDRAVLDVSTGIGRVAVQDGIADGRDILFFGMDASCGEFLFNLGEERLPADLQTAQDIFVQE